jgi:hypothetical protein
MTPTTTTLPRTPDLTVCLPATWREVPLSARQFTLTRRTAAGVVTVQDVATGLRVGVVGDVDTAQRIAIINDAFTPDWDATVREMATVRACSDFGLAEQYLVDSLLAEWALLRFLRRASAGGAVVHRRVCLDPGEAEAWIQAGAPLVVAEPPADRDALLEAGREVWVGHRWYAGQRVVAGDPVAA